MVIGLIYFSWNFRTRHNSYYSLLQRGNKKAIDIWKNEKYVQNTLGPEAKKEKEGGWVEGKKKSGRLTSSRTLLWPVSETESLECLQTNESTTGC